MRRWCLLIFLIQEQWEVIEAKRRASADRPDLLGCVERGLLHGRGRLRKLLHVGRGGCESR